MLAFLIAILSSVGFPSTAFCGFTESGFWETDKKEHFAATSLITTGGYIFLRSKDYSRWESLVTSMAIAAFIGTAKEVHDRQVDSGDIQADFVGAIFAGEICVSVDVLTF